MYENGRLQSRALREDAHAQRFGRGVHKTLARRDTEDLLAQGLGDHLVQHLLALLVAVRVHRVGPVRVTQQELDGLELREVLHVVEARADRALAGVLEAVRERRGQVRADLDAAHGFGELGECGEDVVPQALGRIAGCAELEGL